MIIVLNLLKNLFIFMGIILVIVEVIFLLSLCLFYKIPLASVETHLKENVKNNTIEIISSLNAQITKRYVDVQTELLLASKHVSSVYYSLYKKKEIFPKFKSSILTKFEGCIKSSTEFDEIFKKVYPDQETIQYDENYNTMEYITKSINRTEGENKIIDKLLNNELLKYITIYNSTDNLTDDDKNLICYLVSCLKTLVIRNYLFQESKPNSYLLTLGDNLLQYPPDVLTINQIRKLPQYKITNSDKCNNTYLGKSCFHTFDEKNFPVFLFDLPFINYKKNMEFMHRSCIERPIKNPNLTNTNDYLCVDFNMDDMFDDINFTHNSTVSLFLIGRRESEQQLLYYEDMPDLLNNMAVFDSPLFGKYRLNKNSNPEELELIHAIYFKIFKYFPMITYFPEKVKNILNNYLEIQKIVELSKQKLSDSNETYVIDEVRSHFLGYGAVKFESFDSIIIII